jgi:hypothetical protein
MVFERPRTVMIRVGAGMIGSAPTGGAGFGGGSEA